MNELNDFGKFILADRYLLKETERIARIGKTVVAIQKDGTRAMGKIANVGDTIGVDVDGNVEQYHIDLLDFLAETHAEQMFERVATAIAGAEKTPEMRKLWASNFRDMLSDYKFVPGGRVLAGAGNAAALTLQNCFVLPSPHDSREGIFKTLGDMAELMSRGGGVGINISTLRPKHAVVRGVNGRSSGAVSWGGLFSNVTGLIEQSGSRRGALMLVLEDWHPDVFDFINSKRTAGQITNANISIGLSDDFMTSVKNDGEWELTFPDTSTPEYDTLWKGDMAAWRNNGRPTKVYKTLRARELWDAIVQSAWESAEPGLWFKERVNQQSNSYYYNTLVCPNPCVTGDTLIYTSSGVSRAKDLFDAQTANHIAIDRRMGQDYAEASHVFSSGVKPVYRVQTKEGYYVRATGNHQIMTSKGWVAVDALKSGDQLHILNHEAGFGTNGTHELGSIMGWLAGDGYFSGGRAFLDFYHEKQELAETFSKYVNSIVEHEGTPNRAYSTNANAVIADKQQVSSTRLHRVLARHGMVTNKLRVPETVFTGTRAMQVGFLSALFSADGTIEGDLIKGTSIRLSSIDEVLLEQVQQLLLNFGIASKIYRNRRMEGMKLMPDGKGGQKEYPCQPLHELMLSKANIVAFAEQIGFLLKSKTDKLNDYINSLKRSVNHENFTAEVISITLEGEEQVYDLTEPITHSFIANGIVVHNCAEQSLPNYGVCNLGAINLSKFYDAENNAVQWPLLMDTIHQAVRFLDNVIDVTGYYLPGNAEVQRSERRIGLSTMGLAELLILMGIRYGSPESLEFIDSLYYFITRHSYFASADLAKEKGSFPQYKAEPFMKSGFMKTVTHEIRDYVSRRGMRNVTVLTSAPTGTTATMVDTSTGIEPFFAFKYMRRSRLGTHEQNVRVAEAYLAKHPKVKKLPDHFVTAQDLTPYQHIAVQAAIQRWCDSSISKTANVPNSWTIEQTADLYMELYNLGCKGGTIYRDGSRSEQVLMTEICPDCKKSPLINDGGCKTCKSCGYSACDVK